MAILSRKGPAGFLAVFANKAKMPERYQMEDKKEIDLEKQDSEQQAEEDAGKARRLKAWSR